MRHCPHTLITQHGHQHIHTRLCTHARTRTHARTHILFGLYAAHITQKVTQFYFAAKLEI